MDLKKIFESFNSTAQVADYIVEQSDNLTESDRLDIMVMAEKYHADHKLTGDPLMEELVRRVDSEGNTKRVLDKDTRKRHATQTTGMSSAKRKLIARKAARTKRRDVSAQRRAQKKRKRAIIKRQAMGLSQ